MLSKQGLSAVIVHLASAGRQEGPASEKHPAGPATGSEGRI